MDLERVSGVVSTVQARQIRAGGDWKYSILEIGDRFLKDVIVPDKLSMFLSVDRQVDVWLINKGKTVIAVARPDGVVLVTRHKKPGMIGLVAGICLIPLYGVGLLWLWSRSKLKRNYNLIENEIIPKYSGFQNIN